MNDSARFCYDKSAKLMSGPIINNMTTFRIFANGCLKCLFRYRTSQVSSLVRRVSEEPFADPGIVLKTLDGFEFRVDDDVAGLLEGKRLWAHVSGKRRYAKFYVKGATVFVHRWLMNPPKGMVVDHINNDPLDNRRSNLRIVTQAMNRANGNGRVRDIPYKGVYRRGNRFQAIITANYRQTALGTYDTMEEAARAYDRAATSSFGHMARLNEDVGRVRALFDRLPGRVSGGAA